MNKFKVYYIINEKCNKECSFCYMKNTMVKKSDLTTFKMFKTDNKIYHLVLIGGEPLLNNDEVENILKISQDVEEITITTNGLLLSNSFIKKVEDNYKNTFFQISVYSYNDLLLIKSKLKDLNLYKNIFFHLIISEETIDDLENILLLLKKQNNRIWISLDRYIKYDLINKVLSLIDNQLITKDMFRMYNKAGKECEVFKDRNIVINSDLIIKDCLNRCSINSKMRVNKECLQCDVTFCDACICDDIVLDRKTTCEFFKTLNEYFKVIKNEY